MSQILNKGYISTRTAYHKFKLYYSVNWIATLYFNFKKFPFSIAKKLPVFFFGKITFQSLKGEIIINGPITRGMVGYGQYFETSKKTRGFAEIALRGKLVINGNVHIGKDVLLYIAENAYCEFNHMTCLGSGVKVLCSNNIVFGKWSRIGFESQVMDSNFHQMKNSRTGELYPITGPIKIGNYNSISNRVSIMQDTKTPDYCVVASNAVCVKDYTDLGPNILLGGVPAKLLKNDFSRDWEGEEELLLKALIINW